VRSRRLLLHRYIALTIAIGDLLVRLKLF